MRRARISLCVSRALAATLTALAVTFIFGAQARAQVATASPTQPIIAVRGLLYFPENSSIQNHVGKVLYGGGLDYYLSQKATTRTQLSVDYVERSSGGYIERIFPVTIAEYWTSESNKYPNPFYGIGAGLYFVHQTLPQNTGFSSSANDMVFGGYLAFGMNFTKALFVEGRYHIMQKVDIASPTGLEVNLGYRF